jgi:hypothetical protein
MQNLLPGAYTEVVTRHSAPPPEAIAVEAAAGVQKTRRQVLWGGGIFLAGAALRETDAWVTGRIWSDDASTVRPLEECADLCERPDWAASEVWAGAPGMAHKSGDPVARAMATTALDIPRSRRVMTSINLSDDGVSERTYPFLFSQLGRRCDVLSLACQSMGGPASFEGTRVLSKLPEGYKIPIGRAVLIGSPLRMENVREEFWAKLLSKAAGAYGGGIGGRTLTNIGQALKSNRRAFFSDLIRGVSRAAAQASNGDSPKIEATGLALLSGIDLWSNRRDMRGIITRDTRVLFVPSDLDDVVDCPMAIEDWGNFITDCGGQFDVRPSRLGTGHANVEVGSEAALPWVEATNMFYT